jgi:hypothetical protein
MKKILFSIVLTLVISLSYGQYNYAVGLRTGGTSGITAKSNISPVKAVEGIIGFWNYGISVTGLYEKRQNAFDISGMYWYYGYGAHVAFYESNLNGNFNPYWREKYQPYFDESAIGLGLDAITGLEYKIPEILLAISLELKPFLEFTTNGNVWLSFDPGLGLRLVF